MDHLYSPGPSCPSRSIIEDELIVSRSSYDDATANLRRTSFRSGHARGVLGVFKLRRGIEILPEVCTVSLALYGNWFINCLVKPASLRFRRGHQARVDQSTLKRAGSTGPTIFHLRKLRCCLWRIPSRGLFTVSVGPGDIRRRSWTVTPPRNKAWAAGGLDNCDARPRQTVVFETVYYI